MPAALRVLTSSRSSVQVVGVLANSSLIEQILVVPPTDHAHVPRHAVVLALVRHRHANAPGAKRIAPGTAIRIQIRGDILEQTSIGLIIHHAAAPALEDIGGSAALHDGSQLGLKGLIFQHRDIDLHIGMSGHIFIGHILPERFARDPGC